ncbi:hypothetical protein SAMN04488688_102146 [Paenibacillus sp. cl141a]|nr:hypothetical protein SAMN04488688_102146 [Paenibacillus sp. cl141a]
MYRSAPQGVFFMPLGGPPGALLMLSELVGRRIDWTVLTVIISVIAAFNGIPLGRYGKTKSFKDEVAREATTDAYLYTDVSYIKRGIDDIEVDVRIQGQRMEWLTERLTRVEESAKQAYK